MKSWIQLSEKKFKKPILRVGEFQKKTDGTIFAFNQEHLDYFAASFKNRVPVPLEHTTEPDKNRGWVVGMEVEDDVLLGTFEFSETIEDPNIFDTSVYIPIEEGRVQPIEHVALTSYPVVDGLGKFEAIACSLVSPKEEEVVAINWASVRTTLELSEDLTEENFVEILSKRLKAMADEKEDLELKLSEVKPADAPKIDIVKFREKHGKLFKFAHEGRKAKIESLPLSKAVHDKLVEIYCSDEGLALALSDDDDAQDNFDSVIEALEQNENLAFSEESGIQLSDPSKSQESGLVADARRRAEAAKQK